MQLLLGCPTSSLLGPCQLLALLLLLAAPRGEGWRCVPAPRSAPLLSPTPLHPATSAQRLPGCRHGADSGCCGGQFMGSTGAFSLSSD